MHRLTPASVAIATLALCHLVGAPGRAAADDCLCMGSELLFEPVDQVETPDAYVDEGEGAPDADAALAHDAPRPAPVLWCLSANDPRCSRDDDSGEAPYLQILSTPPVILTATPRVPRRGVTRIRFDLELQRGASGVRARLDRPPRG